jgi:hypothetical protein
MSSKWLDNADTVKEVYTLWTQSLVPADSSLHPAALAAPITDDIYICIWARVAEWLPTEWVRCDPEFKPLSRHTELQKWYNGCPFYFVTRRYEVRVTANLGSVLIFLTFSVNVKFLKKAETNISFTFRLTSALTVHFTRNNENVFQKRKTSVSLWCEQKNECFLRFIKHSVLSFI